MTFATLIAFVFSFFLAYTASHYSLSTWGVRTPVTIVVGVLFGVIVAVFATLAVSPLVGL